MLHLRCFNAQSRAAFVMRMEIFVRLVNILATLRFLYLFRIIISKSVLIAKLGLCTQGDEMDWMQENCRRSCSLCRREGDPDIKPVQVVKKAEAVRICDRLFFLIFYYYKNRCGLIHMFHKDNLVVGFFKILLALGICAPCLELMTQKFLI